MDRRDFLRSAALAGACFGARSIWAPGVARAEVPAAFETTLVNLTLRGGPDMRHLIVPPFDSEPGSYGHGYWSNRWSSHGIDNESAAWEGRWNEDYFHVEWGGVPFGVLRKAEWLKDQFEAGNVAIVNNTLGSRTRDHSHSLLVYESGDLSAGPNDLTRDGWGGRLARVTDSNVVSMTGNVRLFCNGPHASDPSSHDNSHVISARNTREIALYHAPALAEEPGHTGSQAVLSRALSSYYAAKAPTVPADSTYRKFIQHEKTLRAFGDLVEARLATVPSPAALEALLDADAGLLDDARFGLQLRNLFDSLACSDIFDFRVGSMTYDGWDSHKNQAASIEPKFEDIFGSGRGLDTLYSELESAMPGAAEQLSFVIGGEFGRQLRANGDGGTDHGRGNTIFVIGPQVAGGLYGDLFPANEAARHSEPNEDIEGITSVAPLFARLCDWVQPGAGAAVFGDTSGAPMEAGVSFAELLRA